MMRNVGGIDQGPRIVAGLVLLALGWFGPLGWWGLIGLLPLATGLIGNCPHYSLRGIHICPLSRRSA